MHLHVAALLLLLLSATQAQLPDTAKQTHAQVSNDNLNSAKVPDLALWVVEFVRAEHGADLRVAIRDRLGVPGGRAVLVSGEPIEGEENDNEKKKKKKSKKRSGGKKSGGKRPTLSIAKSAAFTEENALRDAVLGPILRSYSDTFVGTSILATYVVYETLKGEQSRWYPYLWSLVQEFQATQADNATLAPPLLWDPEGADRRLLEGSWILDRTLEDEAGIVSDYGRVTDVLFTNHADVFDPEQFSLELYLWAWSIIWSRGAWFDGVGQALVPGLDMCALVPAEVDSKKVQNELEFSRGRFTLAIRKETAINGVIECTTQTTSRAANDFYRLYGFFLAGGMNAQETVGFLRNAHILESDPHFPIKMAILEQNNLYSPPYPYSDPPSGLFVTKSGVPKHVVAYFRLRHWIPSRAQIETFVSIKQVPKVNLHKQLNTANEEKAVQDLIDTIERTVDAYAESYEEDKKLLDAGNLNARVYSAIQARYEEKRVLNAARQALIRPAQQAHEQAALKAEQKKHPAAAHKDDISHWFDEEEEESYWDDEEY